MSSPSPDLDAKFHENSRLLDLLTKSQAEIRVGRERETALLAENARLTDLLATADECIEKLGLGERETALRAALAAFVEVVDRTEGLPIREWAKRVEHALAAARGVLNDD